jgi:hypothetical protein
MTTKICPQCDKRLYELSAELAREWVDSARQLCPPCLKRWNSGMAASPGGPRCGGCGRTVSRRGVCEKCEANGVTAPSLFDPAGGAA